MPVRVPVRTPVRGSGDRGLRRDLWDLTPRGLDALARSAAIFDRLRDEWAETLGRDRVQAMESDLRTVTPPQAFRLDAAATASSHNRVTA